MRFIKKVRELPGSYCISECKLSENAFYYGVNINPPPLAEHIVYFPMDEDTIKRLIDSYKRKIPDDLLALYRAMNGASLFWREYYDENLDFALPLCCMNIYGVPKSMDRKRIEPLNISIEDLDRPRETPSSWLKFGSYYKLENDSDRLELFIDTDSLNVFSVKQHAPKCKVIDSWKSLDECLCSIFDVLSKC